MSSLESVLGPRPKKSVFDCNLLSLNDDKEFINGFLDMARPVCWFCNMYCDENYGRNINIVDKKSGASTTQFICYDCVPKKKGEKE